MKSIELLPEAFSRDPERVARFRREAQLLAALNHPNIAAIYGLEEDRGSQFLVLELRRASFRGNEISDCRFQTAD